MERITLTRTAAEWKAGINLGNPGYWLYIQDIRTGTASGDVYTGPGRVVVDRFKEKRQDGGEVVRVGDIVPVGARSAAWVRLEDDDDIAGSQDLTIAFQTYAECEKLPIPAPRVVVTSPSVPTPLSVDVQNSPLSVETQTPVETLPQTPLKNGVAYTKLETVNSASTSFSVSGSDLLPSSTDTVNAELHIHSIQVMAEETSGSVMLQNFYLGIITGATNLRDEYRLITTAQSLNPVEIANNAFIYDIGTGFPAVDIDEDAGTAIEPLLGKIELSGSVEKIGISIYGTITENAVEHRASPFFF